jgi:RNA polymerase sigma factor (TIGR02999 family)
VSTQPEAPGEITQLLEEVSRGSADAFDRLVPLVYGELSALAHRKLRFESPGHTLNTTALVHEAYLRLAGQNDAKWRNRQQFFAVASEAMRRILIDYAKQRRAEKRGAGVAHLPLEAAESMPASGTFALADEQAAELLAIDAALHRLAEFNPEGARIVQYRFFGALTNAEIAELLGTSERTVRRSWTVAKAWLRRELGAPFYRSSLTLRGPNSDAGSE